MFLLDFLKKKIKEKRGKRDYLKYGSGVIISHPLFIIGKKRMTIGNGVRFLDGARIECISEHNGVVFDSYIHIGDNTSFEQGAHITSAGALDIGSNCVFSARVMITNISHDYKQIGVNVLKQDYLVKNVEIGDNCFVGMDVKIFPGVKIGKNVIVGANSIVMTDLPDYSVCVGVPAKPIKKYSFETNNWERIK